MNKGLDILVWICKVGSFVVDESVGCSGLDDRGVYGVGEGDSLSMPPSMVVIVEKNERKRNQKFSCEDRENVCENEK